MTANVHRVSFGDEESVVKLVVMVVQLFKYSTGLWTVHFKRVKCVVCEFNFKVLFIYF